jgi:hypothetical protein
MCSDFPGIDAHAVSVIDLVHNGDGGYDSGHDRSNGLPDRYFQLSE